MADLINISPGNAAITALMGYLVVFAGLIMLMLVVMIIGKIMTSGTKKAAPAAGISDPLPVKSNPAPGTAGELKLYDTDPKDAAMVMAIVANKLGKPLNELRFISIREVKDDEI